MNCRILIVDDSPLLRATARRAVLQAGVPAASVREAANGKEALLELAREPVELVLLDLNMPVMDGYQFVEAKAARPELAAVTVALVTTEGNAERLQRMRALGVTHYLHKPFAPEELRALVQQLTRQTQEQPCKR
jgi:two-component system chemotaxis response regulator CheY